jgi:CubicO group peptidase (beta-lactamase class C family)
VTARVGRAATLSLAASLAACAPAVRSAAGRAALPPAEAEARMERMIQDSARTVLERALADSAFPGAFAVVGSRDHVYARIGVGHLDWAHPTAGSPPQAGGGQSPVPDEDTLWDLASLTKVVGMTTAMMQLVGRGLVDLDAPVQRYLPEFVGPYKDRVTVRHLLTHSAGLPAWRPLHKEATSPGEALALVYLTPLDTVPGARMVYSDLGAILLGKVVEHVEGWPLDQYLAEHVFGPLGMTSTGYRPDSSLLPRIAPTEFDPWRQRHLRGEVHDENAYALGGVSAHAGLFSSARDLTIFAQMLLGGGAYHGVQVVPAAVLGRFTAVQDSALSNRALGWEVPNGQNSAGHRMSPHAFGHTGFTGTSIWVDPDRDLFVILLTNRVNPTRENRRIGGVRVALADAVVAAYDAARAPGAASPLSPVHQP